MNLYLSASFSRQDEIRNVARNLGLAGYTVISRWLDMEPLDFFDPTLEKRFMERALIDLDDVMKADVLIRFTDDLNQPTVPSSLATGSRMFEMGYAYKQGSDIIVVGGRQNLFDVLPSIFHVEDINELLPLLKLLESKYGA
jgi:hypothetical protein